jgi:hypothetical protein
MHLERRGTKCKDAKGRLTQVRRTNTFSTLGGGVREYRVDISSIAAKTLQLSLLVEVCETRSNCFMPKTRNAKAWISFKLKKKGHRPFNIYAVQAVASHFQRLGPCTIAYR